MGLYIGASNVGGGGGSVSEATLAGYVSSGGAFETALSDTIATTAVRPKYDLDWYCRQIPRPSDVNRVMSTPPTVGALATTSAITNGVLIPSGSNSGTSGAVLYDKFAYRAGGQFVMAGTTFPDRQFIKATSLTSTTPTNQASYCADFLFDGTTLEVVAKGNGGFLRIRVDGELVAAAPTTLTNSGSTYYMPVTFATRALRRIALEFSSVVLFGGVTVGPNDSVWKPAVRGPRCIVVGDSFTEGTGGDGAGATNWVRTFADAMGWPDTWSSGSGGTGYLNPGTGGRVKFRDRITNDVLNQAPDIVIWAGGINDQTTYTATDIGAETLACYQAVKTALPNTLQIVLSPFWRGGVETYGPGLIDTRDAIKASAQAVGAYFVDVIENPLGTTPIATTLAAANAISAATLSVTAFIPRQATVLVDTGANREYRLVTNVSGVGPYTLTVAAMGKAHASGASVTQVGPGFWTGTGHVGATTGSGNSDLLVSSDGTHPSQTGHDELGRFVAQAVRQRLLRS